MLNLLKWLLCSCIVILFSCSSDDNGEVLVEEVSAASIVEILEIGRTTATVSADIFLAQGNSIVAKGVCWSTQPDPTVDNATSTVEGIGNSSFVSELTDLAPQTNYYVRAYIADNSGTYYSNSLSFETELCGSELYEGSFFLQTQRAVDAFPSLGYSEISENLQIGFGTGTEDIINDLSPLFCLEKVGSLQIGATNLENLDGLENLMEVESYINLNTNTSLENIDGLSNAQGNLERIFVQGNSSLLNLDGLSGISSVNSGSSASITIFDNESLLNIDGLLNVTAVNGSISISRNPALNNINGLSGVSSVSQSIRVENNDNLESLSGLENITSLKGNLEVNFNQNLQSIQGLNSLVSIGGAFEFIANGTTSNLDPLSSLVSVGDYFDVVDNEFLADFCGITTLVTQNGIGANFNVFDNLYNPTEEDIINGNCSQ